MSPGMALVVRDEQSAFAWPPIFFPLFIQVSGIIQGTGCLVKTKADKVPVFMKPIFSPVSNLVFQLKTILFI